MSLNTFEFAGKLAKETNIPIEHIDLILTEMTNALNETLLSGNNQFPALMSFIKKKQGLNKIITLVTERTGLPEEEIITVINYMCTKMKASLKSGGVQNVLKMLKTMKAQSKSSIQNKTEELKENTK